MAGQTPDIAWQQHCQFVARTLAASSTTDVLHRDAFGRWSAVRRHEQRSLVDHLWAKASATALLNAEAVIAGGMAGAGKTTVLTGHAGISLADFVVVNPDDIKEEMARRGMIPAVPGLSLMEASPLAHEEASELGKRLALLAYNNRTNVLWDITMSSVASVRDRVAGLRQVGYVRVDGIFIDVPYAVGVARAAERHRQGQTELAQGVGLGGRFVIPQFLEASKPTATTWTSRNREIFEAVRKDFDSTAEYDNSGRPPVLRSTTGDRWR